MKELKIYYHKYHLIIWPVATGLSSLIVLALVIFPQLLAYLNTRGEISKAQTSLSAMEVKAEELENFDDSSAKERLQVALSVLPISQDVPVSLSVLQGLVRGAGLELKNTAYSSSPPVGGKASFQLQVTVMGPISGVRNLLLSMEDAPQIFQIQSINIRFLKTVSAVEADLPISVFYESPPRAVGDINKPITQLSQKEKDLLDHYSQIIAALHSLTLPEATASVRFGKTDPFQ